MGEDVSFNAVQQAALKWSQGVEEKEVAEAASVRSREIDFEADNVSFSKHQDGVVSAKANVPEIATPKVLVNQENAVSLRSTINRLSNDFSTGGEERENAVGALAVFSQAGEAGGAKKAPHVHVNTIAILSLITTLTNKGKDTIDKANAEFAKGQINQLEQHWQDVADQGMNTNIMLASSFTALGGNLFKDAAKSEIFNKKVSAGFNMVSNVASQGSEIIKLFDEEKKEKKSLKAIDSQRKSEVIKASMQGLMGIERQLGGMIEQVRKAVKASYSAGNMGGIPV